MMRGSSGFSGVVSADRTLLTAVPGHDDRIPIERQFLDGDLGKEPPIQVPQHVLVGGLREFAGSRITALKFAIRAKPKRRPSTRS